MILKKLRGYVGDFREFNRERKQLINSSVIGKKDRIISRIVRFVHSIEKGLSIDNPRPEFGYEKILTLYNYINEYLKIDNIDKSCIYMAADALEAYCNYHSALNLTSPKLEHIKNITAELSKIKKDDGIDGTFGGVLTIQKSDMKFDFACVEKLFKTRHSIRQFKKEELSEETIKKAIELAQTAPSACNRQAVRAYAIDSKKFIENYTENLQGVGGFADDCDKFILITGKISAYEEPEYKQFIVSAGIFVGYLTLALHGLGLGACVVQRSLRPNDSWIQFCMDNDIPLDEQLICLVAVGNLNDEMTVPLSKRFDVNTIFRTL